MAESLLVVTVAIGVDDVTGAVTVKATPDDDAPFSQEDLKSFGLTEVNKVSAIAGRVSHWIDKIVMRKIQAVEKELAAKESELQKARKAVGAMLK